VGTKTEGLLPHRPAARLKLQRAHAEQTKSSMSGLAFTLTGRSKQIADWRHDTIRMNGCLCLD